MVKYFFQFQARNSAEEKSKALVLSKEYKMIDCPVIQPKEVSMFFFHQTSSEDSSFYSKLLPEEASAKLSSMSAV